MNKSQLRKLAREHALGRLDEGDYRQRRRALIDDIVSGKVAIVREAPPPPPPPSSEDPTTKVTIGGPQVGPRLSPVYIIVGAAIVIALVWALVPPGTRERQPDQGTVVEPPRQPPEISRARLLIEEFVAQKDFSAFSIASFKESWSHLSPGEKRQAYSAHWFNDLINLISDEIKTQNALADSVNAANAAETGARLSDFASFLGISDHVTEFRGAEAPAAVAVTQPETERFSPPAPPDTTPQAPSPPEATRIPPESVIDTSEPTPPQTPVSNRKTVRTVADTEWLDGQPEDGYTLQLFAVNRLDKIQSLIASNPEVGLQVLVSARAEPRYRVVYGSFESAEAARSAHASLPEEIRQAQPAPLVKAVSSLRDEADNSDWLADIDAKKFTLQLFATDSAESARRLLAAYPALELSLLDTTDPGSRYRVLYGAFDTEDSAKAAASGLPPALLRDAGNPLIKPVSELHAVTR